ncbi:MAG: DUF1294 domain-containing protein [Paludibacter sp.]|nr:DUF1294 domain-containing protein [Paludibacter sp.]
MKLEIVYLVIINLLSGLVFSIDKNAARKSRRRIPERTLHLLEALGGVFATVLLMYTLRHKNRKLSYWVWTWLVLIAWIILISRIYSIL